MVMTIARDGALVESTARHIIPKERYVSRDFFDLEMERLWPRVWQMACREEEVPRVGDFLEYVIGDQSILVTRSGTDTIRAFYNTCPHRGTRLATGVGNFATGRDPVPLPRLALRAGRHQQGGRRPRRLPAGHVRRGRGSEPDPGGPVGWVRLHQHGPELRVARVLPRAAPGAARHLPLREDAVPVLPVGDHPGQLEVGARRLQRELPRAGHPSPAAPLVRRHRHPLRPLGKHNHMGGLGEVKHEIRPSPGSASSRGTTTSASCWPS